MTAGPILSVEHLTVRYDGLVAVHDVSLTVEDGEICGLIGPNGAGKSTLLDAVSGFVAAEGVVRLGEDVVTGAAPHRLAALGIRRTFQSLELFDDLSVSENLVISATVPRWWSPLRDAIWPSRPDAAQLAAIDSAAHLTGIEHLLDAVPSGLSNGERHRVALARALVGSPRLLLLDEPGAGLDPDETEQLAGLLRSLPAAGVAVLLVDHDMALVMSVCDRIHVLERGTLLASGTPSEVRSDALVLAAYLGNDPGAPDPDRAMGTAPDD